MTKIHYGGAFRGVLRSGRAPEVIDAEVDIEPVPRDDGAPLVTYAYCAVRSNGTREFLDRATLAASPKEVEERILTESSFAPETSGRYVLVRIARVTVEER